MDPARLRHVAYFLPNLAGGGVARAWLNLVEESLRRGLEVDLVEPALNIRHVGPLLQSLVADDPRRTEMRSLLLQRPRRDAAAEIARIIVEGND